MSDAFKDAHKYYEAPGVAEFYSSYRTELFRAEEVILRAMQGSFKDMPILEIGVGGGRLVPYLQALSKDYIGIDYAERMIEVCRKKFEGVTFLTCDAKSMPAFKEGQISVVVFWGNGLDDVPPRDRLMILRECYRILKMNGVLLFSSHNLYWRHRFESSVLDGISWRKWYRAADPLRLKVLVWYLLKRLWGWVSNKGYVVLPYYEFSPRKAVLPTYWVKKEAQERQLLNIGFSEISVVALDGEPFDGRSRHRDCMFFYSAKKKTELGSQP